MHLWINFFLNADTPSRIGDAVFIAAEIPEQTQKRKAEAPVVCTLLCRAHLEEKHYIQYICTPPLSSRLQRLLQKLERTGIDRTSDGSGIDNWTLRHALLSWSALKISTVRPSEGGCCSGRASVECLKRSLLTWFTSASATRRLAEEEVSLKYGWREPKLASK